MDSDVESEIDGAERAVVRVREEGRIAVPALNASKFHSVFGVDGVPTIEEINRRLTLDMHTRDVLGEILFTKKIVRNHKNGNESMIAGELKNGPRDIITYFFLKPKEKQRKKKENADTSGQALDGHPVGADAEIEPIELQAQEQGSKASSSGETDPTRISPAKPDDKCGICKDGQTDMPEGFDPLEQDIGSDDESDWEECRGRAEADLRAEATSLHHLLTHLPKNKFCPACVRAKAQSRGGEKSEDKESAEAARRVRR